MKRSRMYIARIVCLTLLAGSLSACSLFRRKNDGAPAGTPAAATGAPETDIETTEIEITDETDGRPEPENETTPAPEKETSPADEQSGAAPSAAPEQQVQPSAGPEPSAEPSPEPAPDDIVITENGDIELPELP